MKAKSKKLITFFSVFFALALLIIFIVLAWLGSYSAKCMSNEEKLELALKIGRLSSLPNSDFTINGTSNPFSSTFYFRFPAQPDEFQEFITSSPGLHNSGAQEITAELKNSVDNKGYTWFDVESIEKGKYYQIPQDSEGCYGAVFYDEVKNIVYVTVSRS